MCTGARQRGRNGLRYHSPTGIPSHTAHRIKSRSKQGKQSVQTGIIAEVMSPTLTHIKSSKDNKSSPLRESSGPWQPRSGGIGARALNPITAGPLPATLLGPLCVSSQPMCSSEHPTKTPGPIGLSPPSNGRSGLVHPCNGRRTGRHHARSTTTHHARPPTSRNHRNARQHAVRRDAFHQPPERHEYVFYFSPRIIEGSSELGSRLGSSLCPGPEVQA